MMFRPLPLIAALAAGVGCMSSANAFFSDDEARLAINAMRKQMVTMQSQISQLESAQKANLAVSNQVDAIRQTQAQLSGRIEVLENQLAQQQKNTKDLYTDLDSRLRAMNARIAKVEPQTVQVDGAKVQVQPREKTLYDAGMSAFQAGKYQDSITQFQQLDALNPRSPYLPEALYWQGNAFFALQQYSEAASAQERVIRDFSGSKRVPDAMLSLASAQTALGSVRAAYATYDALKKRYPGTEQSKLADQRMTELKPALPVEKPAVKQPVTKKAAPAARKKTR